VVVPSILISSPGPGTLHMPILQASGFHDGNFNVVRCAAVTHDIKSVSK